MRILLKTYLIHNRKTLVWSSEQYTNVPFNIHILGQGAASHGCDSVGGPEQMTPPFEGGGLVHAWLLCWVPVPHVTEHATHSVHAVHPPSTGIAKYQQTGVSPTVQLVEYTQFIFLSIIKEIKSVQFTSIYIRILWHLKTYANLRIHAQQKRKTNQRNFSA